MKSFISIIGVWYPLYHSQANNHVESKLRSIARDPITNDAQHASGYRRRRVEPNETRLCLRTLLIQKKQNAYYQARPGAAEVQTSSEIAGSKTKAPISALPGLSSSSCWGLTQSPGMRPSSAGMRQD